MSHQPHGAERHAAETVEKACHCEPVRAAKQVPLGYTLAWQSVSKTHKFCVFRRFLSKKIRIPTSLRAAKQVPLGVLLGMTGVRFIDTLSRMVRSAMRLSHAGMTISKKCNISTAKAPKVLTI